MAASLDSLDCDRNSTAGGSDDPRDPATRAGIGKAQSDYTKFLDPHGLHGARLGVARKYFGFNSRVDQIIEDCLAEVRQQGAGIGDPVGLPAGPSLDGPENEVLAYELKADLNAYLAAREHTMRVKSLVSRHDLPASSQPPGSEDVPAGDHRFRKYFFLIIPNDLQGHYRIKSSFLLFRMLAFRAKARIFMSYAQRQSRRPAVRSARNWV
ncbi:MAG TPA: hypothetical protein VHZ07_00515 [Bryobacteraceae bacterium]|nr:hypothetical protein [Bryobacteraceae bacterium]